MADAPEPKPDEGPPMWVMTFADLMSLLLAFFVLLFSFSELDKAKYKQVGGSMREAFGVQKEIPVRDPLKGLEIVATEFSPGRPDPTKLNELRQETTNVYKRYLAAYNSTDPNATAARQQSNGLRAVIAEVDAAEASEELTGALKKGLEEMVTERQADFGKGGAEKKSSGLAKFRELLARLDEVVNVKDSEGKEASPQSEGAETVESDAEDAQSLEEQIESDKRALKVLKSKVKDIEAIEEAMEKIKDPSALDVAAMWASSKLAREVAEGQIQIMRSDSGDGKRLVIRVSENGTFQSGSAEITKTFRQTVFKIGEVLDSLRGEITVAGHTDNRPISTRQYRSNWELSTSRAVSVVHEFTKGLGLSGSRFQAVGFGDTRPVDSNETREGRNKNRRVEISLLERDSADRSAAISGLKDRGVWIGSGASTTSRSPNRNATSPASVVSQPDSTQVSTPRQVKVEVLESTETSPPPTTEAPAVQEDQQPNPNRNGWIFTPIDPLS